MATDALGVTSSLFIPTLRLEIPATARKSRLSAPRGILLRLLVWVKSCSIVMVFLVGVLLQVRVGDPRLVRVKRHGLLKPAAKLMIPCTRLVELATLAIIPLLPVVGRVVPGLRVQVGRVYR